MNAVAEPLVASEPPPAAAILPQVARTTRKRSMLELARRLRTDLTVLYENDRFYREDVIVRRSLLTNFIIAMKPDLIRHVMVTNASNYQRGTMTKNTVRAWAGDGILTSEGEAWRSARRILEPWFHRRTLDQFTEPTIAATRSALDGIEDAVEDGRPISVEEFCTSLTTRIIAQSLFSCDIDARMDDLHAELTEIQEEMTKIKLSDLLGFGRFLPKRYNARTRATLRNLKAIFDPIIEQRRTSGEKRPDFLQSMLDAGNKPDGTPRLTEQQIYDNVFSVFLGAPESTGYALVWTIYLLSRFPDVQEKVFAEADEILGSENFCSDDLAKMTYSWCVMQEAMRLYPPVHSFTREAIGDDQFGDVKIPRGSTIFFPVYAIHRHEKLWDQPDAFNPERFRHGARAGKDDLFSFLAFSTGPRFCVGRPFAEMELKLIIGMLVRRYRIKPAGEGPVGLKGLVTLRPASRIEVRLEPR